MAQLERQRAQGWSERHKAIVISSVTHQSNKCISSLIFHVCCTSWSPSETFPQSSLPLHALQEKASLGKYLFPRTPTAHGGSLPCPQAKTSSTICPFQVSVFPESWADWNSVQMSPFAPDGAGVEGSRLLPPASHRGMIQEVTG